MRALLSSAALSLIAAGCASPGGGAGGGPHPPHTPTPGIVRFAAVGDTGTGDTDAYRVAAAIGDKCGRDGCDFILMLGDLIYPGGVTSVDDPDWTQMVEQPYHSLGYPIRPVLGNHEYGSGGTDFERAKAFVDRAEVDPQWLMPGPHYAVRDGEDVVALLVFDTNGMKLDEELFFAQTSFAHTELEESVATRWRIAATHHPYLSNGNHGNVETDDPVRAFYEGSVCGKIDLLLTAHDHTRQILPGNEKCPTPSVISGAGSMTGTLPGDNPSEFESEELGFAWVEATDDALKVEMVDVEGSVDFEWELPR